LLQANSSDRVAKDYTVSKLKYDEDFHNYTYVRIVFRTQLHGYYYHRCYSKRLFYA
jgi:hypothetical protein